MKNTGFFKYARLTKCLKCTLVSKLNFDSLHCSHVQVATKSHTKLLLLSILAHQPTNAMSCSEKKTVVCSDILTGWLCCLFENLEKKSRVWPSQVVLISCHKTKILLMMIIVHIVLV